MPSPIDQALTSLLPTLSPLPTELTDLATSLLAQSRSRASHLKPEEEIGRTYACCHIACERLGKKLGLEIGKPAPPVQPRVYGKLKTFLGSSLRTAVTPRKRREDLAREEGASTAGVQVTPTRSQTSAVGKEMKAGAHATPVKGQVAAPSSGRKRKIAVLESTAQAELAAPAPILPTEGTGEDDLDGANDDNDDDGEHQATPVKRPSKTPLRRKEKHAKFADDGWEDVGAAGLLAGLGTMFQPAIDWLSEERRAEYAVWEKGIMREIAVIERQRA